MDKKILSINPKNEALIFLNKRINSKNYRGTHLVQHQRYSYHEIVGSLLAIYAVVKDGKLTVPKGDPATDTDVADFPDFKKMVTLYSSTFNKGTYKSVKKIDFLNFARMGFLNRYNSKGNIISLDKRASDMVSISLSEAGIDLLLKPENADYIFTKGLDMLFDGFISEIYSILQNENIKGFITQDEFVLFVSYLGMTLDEENDPILINDVIKYITEYRKLTRINRLNAIDHIKEMSQQTKSLGKSKGQIDYDNWRNQAGSIFDLLKFAANLQIDNNNSLIFGTKKKGSLITLERSLKEKENYFKEHKIDYDMFKGKGYELHHIYPLALAENDTEFMAIDSWQNLIYIDGKKHAEITQNKNRHIELEFFNKHDAKFKKPDDSQNFIIAKKDENIIYNESLQKIMLQKNKNLLQL